MIAESVIAREGNGLLNRTLRPLGRIVLADDPVPPTLPARHPWASTTGGSRISARAGVFLATLPRGNMDQVGETVTLPATPFQIDPEFASLYVRLRRESRREATKTRVDHRRGARFATQRLSRTGRHCRVCFPLDCFCTPGLSPGRACAFAVTDGDPSECRGNPGPVLQDAGHAPDRTTLRGEPSILRPRIQTRSRCFFRPPPSSPGTSSPRLQSSCRRRCLYR